MLPGSMRTALMLVAMSTDNPYGPATTAVAAVSMNCTKYEMSKMPSTLASQDLPMRHHDEAWKAQQKFLEIMDDCCKMLA